MLEAPGMVRSYATLGILHHVAKLSPNGLLFDTSVWISIDQTGAAPEALQKIAPEVPVYTCSVVIAELRFGTELAADPLIRMRRSNLCERVEAMPMLESNLGVAKRWAALSAYLKQHGKVRQRTHDLWLAAFAFEHELHLVTFNEKDFADIPNLALICL
jgi:predicted nucleic acid-binding protein